MESSSSNHQILWLRYLNISYSWCSLWKTKRNDIFNKQWSCKHSCSLNGQNILYIYRIVPCKCLCYFVVDFIMYMIHNQICEHNITCRHDDFGHTHKSGVKEELGLLTVDKGTVFELSLFKSSFVPKNWLRSPSQPFLYMIILFCQLNSFPKRQGFTYSSRILTLITKYSLSCHLSSIIRCCFQV